MRIHRFHGLGNDYLVYAEGPPLTPDLVRAICNRHTGVGGDGILEAILPAEGADYGLRIYNPDGSLAEKSGNGIRIFSSFLHRYKNAPDHFSIWTAGGLVRVWILPTTIRVEMGHAILKPSFEYEGMTVYPVDLGNPHAVVLSIPPNWLVHGPHIEHAVPHKTNVQFAEVKDRHTVKVRVWERGAGHTLSSGSSACAVAAVTNHLGLVDSPVRIEMEGGTFQVRVGHQMELEGPVEEIGVVQVDAGWVQKRRSAQD